MVQCNTSAMNELPPTQGEVFPTAAEERLRESEAGTPVPAWLPCAMFALGVTYLALTAAGPITDPDTWWHLRLGENFRNGWSLSNPGRLSPFGDRSWVPSQWLFEGVASYLNDVFGLAGVQWLTGFGVLALGGALFVACRTEGKALAAAMAAMLALGGSLGSIAPRPQLVSFVLLAVFTGAWLRTARDLRPRWWLVPLSGVWACSHGMWFTGVLAGLAVVLGLVLDRRLTFRQTLRLLLVPVLGVCAAALTPVGPELLLAPITTSGAAPFITEWQPPNFREITPLVTAAMLMLIVMTWSRASRASWSHVLLLLLAFGWTALSARTVALGAVMAAPLLAGAIHQWTTTSQVQLMKRRERASVATGLLIGLLLLTVLIPRSAATDSPLAANVESALDRLPTGTVVFNEYTLGGWLEWEHPNLSTVIDGMTDAYDPAYLAKYVRASRLDPGWETFVRGTGARHALLNTKSPLATELQKHLGWRPVATSPSSVLLVRPGT